MYVLSQKGDITINVKSTVGFRVQKNEFGKGWEIRTIFPDSEYRIAVYDTEERAKEVLQLILENYDYITRALADMNGGNSRMFSCYLKMPKE